MQCKSVLSPSLRVSNIWLQTFNVCFINLKWYSKNSSDRNPYHVLGLKTSCSTRDVKKAYIKLCKELHPDMKPGDPSQHKKFVELNKAYTTLVNVDSRKQFDHDSENTSYDTYQHVYRKTSSPFDQGHWQKEEAWYERENYQQYYQQQGKLSKVKRVKDSWIVCGCFFLVFLGSIMYFSAYSYATRYTLQKVDERSRRIRENYQDARSNALDSGREEQLEKLKRRWSI
ncbi:dnaJ subfamily C member 4 [Nephila pilipes]|uniref:DnaJ subfamily C member 4 n=1 Tax=Nephila pilipes TaxID=299642 RepID=A0A8X6PG67_NEPPI|nr:dnaJ subfamily C member 4 [Nephila pilipes]